MSPARTVVHHCLPTRRDLLDLALALLALTIACVGLAYSSPPQCTLPAKVKQCTLPPRLVSKSVTPSNESSGKPSKIARKQIRSFCPCSPSCECGCNEGLPCKCGKPTPASTTRAIGKPLSMAPTHSIPLYSQPCCSSVIHQTINPVLLPQGPGQGTWEAGGFPCRGQVHVAQGGRPWASLSGWSGTYGLVTPTRPLAMMPSMPSFQAPQGPVGHFAQAPRPMASFNPGAFRGPARGPVMMGGGGGGGGCRT
jgi:hypothetical protein